MKFSILVTGALCSLVQLTLAGSELEFVTNNDANLQNNGYLLDGQVLWPGELSSAAQVRLVLLLDGGGRRTAWPRLDGSFRIPDVPPGTHILEVVATNLVYPQVRVDVDPDFGGKITAQWADQPGRLFSKPLSIRPIHKADYFEVKQPFNVIAFLKTPYGMMLAVGVLAVFVLPKMKIDPEEYKEVMETRETVRARERAARQQPERLAGGSGSSQGGGGTRRRRD